jgi:hypothetical protein
MTIKSIWTRGLLAAVLGCAVFTACEYKGPAAVWNPNADLGLSPTITSVVPADSAGPGVSTIILNGQNFTSDTSKLKVYFNNQLAFIKSCSNTQIELYRPSMSGDVTIWVMIKDAYATDKVAGYFITEGARLYGNLPTKNLAFLITTDSQENVYVLTITKSIIQISPQEVRTTVGAQGSSYKGVTGDFKVGPDGNLYLNEKNKTQMYRIVMPTGGDAQKYAVFPKNVSNFDFDSNGNIIGAGDKTGISIIAPDLTTRGLNEFQDLTVKYLRVFKGFVYVTDGAGIWKSQILSDGNLGPKESIFQIANMPAYSTNKILSLEMSNAGQLFASINANDPVLLIKSDGTAEPFYYGLLPANGGQLFWGSGNMMYLSMKTVAASADLLRIDMGEKGASK